MKLYDELVARGLIKDISSEDLIDKLNNESLTFYLGTDPTADSLHIGHYSTFLTAKRLQKAGHKPILLVGAATGLVGDPRGTGEREKADYDTIMNNYEKLSKQVENVFGIKAVNNYDWFRDYKYIDFLRDYGKYINVNYMINKELVKRQMEVGISYAEFSYMLIQGVDFKYLHENYGVNLQIGGSDQWGNLTTGIELTRKLCGDEVYAFSMPLVTDSKGKKFGKSEGNAIWLDINKTSSYELYQYLINLEDVMMDDYLKRFTFLTLDEIDEIVKKHNEKPEERYAQKILAREIITDIHREDEYKKAVNISESLFSGDYTRLSEDELLVAFKGIKSFEINNDLNIVDMLVDNKICSSKREAREIISGNAISINNNKVNDCEYIISKDDTLFNKYIILKKGKKNRYLVVCNY